MTVELVVSGGLVVTPAGLVSGGVACDGGKIVALGTALPTGRTSLDAAGALILPGAVDPHVHFRDPGWPEREDFGTGSAAAALGGVTTVLDMPNTRPATMDGGSLRAKLAAIGDRSYVDFGLIGGADGSNPDGVAELAAAGAAAIKVFLYPRRDPPPAGVTDDAVLLEVFETIAAAGLPVAVHAENADLVAAGRAREADRQDWLSHLDSRPALAEAEAVSRAVLFARAAGARLHVCHLSSSDGAGIVADAKDRGAAVTAEITPQHLLLDAGAAEELGPDLTMVPPVRRAGHRAALWAAFAAGTVDMLATDHAPHSAEAKHRPPLQAATGLVGVQWSVPLLLSEVAQGRLPLRRAVEAMSTRAAVVFGLHPRKGVLRPGADADLAVVRLGSGGRLDPDRLASRGRSTPFAGREVAARVEHTVVGGRPVVVDGALVGEPSGRFVPRLEPRPEEAEWTR